MFHKQLSRIRYIAGIKMEEQNKWIKLIQMLFLQIVRLEVYPK
jgi:hypothetical protein